MGANARRGGGNRAGGDGGDADRHNTLSAATASTGLALTANLTATVALTNTIFHGYATGVLAGPVATSVTLEDVLWSAVTTPTEGAAITVTNAFAGAAAFANAALYDYHLTALSAARDVGVPTGLAVDFDGDPRPIGAAPDLGADEYLALTPIAPTAGDDTANTPEDTPITLSVLANDSDLNNDPLTVSALGLPGSGSAVLSGTTQIVYTPSLDFTGPVVFTYTASDGALTDTATVTVTVTPVNDNPTISAVGDLTVTVNTNTGPLGFTVGDVEAGGAVTVTASSANQTLVPNANILVGGSGISRTVTVTPAAGQSGVVTITLTVSDGQGGNAQTSFTLTVFAYRQFLPLITR